MLNLGYFRAGDLLPVFTILVNGCSEPGDAQFARRTFFIHLLRSGRPDVRPAWKGRRE
jgi:hypothetical protein